jgi:hypothetical protein
MKGSLLSTSPQTDVSKELSLRRLAKSQAEGKMRRQSAEFGLDENSLALLLGELDRLVKFVDDDRSSGPANLLDECRRLPGQADGPNYRPLQFLRVHEPLRPYAWACSAA